MERRFKKLQVDILNFEHCVLKPRKYFMVIILQNVEEQPVYSVAWSNSTG